MTDLSQKRSTDRSWTEGSNGAELRLDQPTTRASREITAIFGISANKIVGSLIDGIYGHHHADRETIDDPELLADLMNMYTCRIYLTRQDQTDRLAGANE
jgi:hypothetical protein